MFVCLVFHFLLFKNSNQGEIIKQFNYKRPDLSQTSKQRVHSKQFCTKWVTDMIQEGWPVVSQNGTLKRQTDYLFMCWSGGCFCPSCHTSISNVRGPHLGCVKMHHVETEKNLSLLAHTETALSEDPSLALAPAVKLFGIASWIWTQRGEGMGFLILSSTWECWKEKKSRACAVSGGGRSCVMAGEWKRKEKDSQCCFICQGVGWCKQTRSLCKLLILWTVKSSR